MSDGSRATVPFAPLELYGAVQSGEVDGAGVVTHQGAALRDFLDGRSLGIEIIESDVGRLAFPAYDRFIRTHVRDHGHWERFESSVLRSIVHPGELALNVGANVGYTTLLLARSVGPAGRVVAIEPSVENFRLLTYNLDMNGVRNVLPILAAAGATTGVTRLSLSPDNSGDHRIALNPFEVGSRPVPIVTLDDLLPDHAVPRVLACDAQGADLEVLRGARRVIERARPTILIEFWPTGIIGLGGDPMELDEHIAAADRSHVLVADGLREVTSVAEILSALDEFGLDHASVLLGGAADTTASST